MHESTYSKILSKHTLNSHKNIPLLASFKIARGYSVWVVSQGDDSLDLFHLKKC